MSHQGEVADLRTKPGKIVPLLEQVMYEEAQEVIGVGPELQFQPQGSVFLSYITSEHLCPGCTMGMLTRPVSSRGRVIWTHRFSDDVSCIQSLVMLQHLSSFQITLKMGVIVPFLS